jgi:hypothetical protein
MSNPNKMINDPYAIELQVLQMLSDKYNWTMGKKHRELNREDFQNEMKKKYSYLENASPMLFEKILSGFFDDKNNLNMMMNMLNLSKEIYDGKKKQEDVDKGLGQILANKFIKPVVDKLDNDKSK